MFKFLGINYLNFRTDKGDVINGFKFYFCDDETVDNSIGVIPWNVFLSNDKAEKCGLKSSSDMASYSSALNKPVEFIFNRKGQIQKAKFSNGLEMDFSFVHVDNSSVSGDKK